MNAVERDALIARLERLLDHSLGLAPTIEIQRDTLREILRALYRARALEEEG